MPTIFILLFAITALFIGFLIGFDTGRRTAPKRGIRTPLERRLRPKLSDEELNHLREHYRS